MIETPRLRVHPLTHDQLIKYIQCDPALEIELGLQPATRKFSPELVEALEQSILPRVANKKNDFRYVTLWTIFLKNERTSVGDLCFKGEPDEKGEIEIGYGTYDEHRQKGYMTEAVGGMLAWAGEQKGVRSMMAETEVSNSGSMKILQNNGFVIYKEKDNAVWLRCALRKKDN